LKAVKNDIGSFFAARFLGLDQYLHAAIRNTLRSSACDGPVGFDIEPSLGTEPEMETHQSEVTPALRGD
jgi:hypothetical protein